jgi:hypothetical protein
VWGDGSQPVRSHPCAVKQRMNGHPADEIPSIASRNQLLIPTSAFVRTNPAGSEPEVPFSRLYPYAVAQRGSST